MKSHPGSDAAFGAGSDARIEGLPLTFCPYAVGSLRRFWREGWLDVQNNYGADSPPGKRTYLPPVRK